MHPSQGSGAALGQPQDTSASPPAEPRRHLLLILGWEVVVLGPSQAASVLRELESLQLSKNTSPGAS